MRSYLILSCAGEVETAHEGVFPAVYSAGLTGWPVRGNAVAANLMFLQCSQCSTPGDGRSDCGDSPDVTVACQVPSAANQAVKLQLDVTILQQIFQNLHSPVGTVLSLGRTSRLCLCGPSWPLRFPAQDAVPHHKTRPTSTASRVQVEKHASCAYHG